MSQKKPFIRADFKVPDSLQNEHFRIRMLTVNDVVQDYDAVMSSMEHLNKEFPYGGWPKKDMTLEQNLIDLGWHQKEFQTRRSFAYTVCNLDESQVLGSIYIDPSDRRNFDAEIYLWIRTSELDKGLDSILFDSVKNWISEDWPFQNVAYPGREISWKQWKITK